jgi:2-aminoadipate transaminase
VYEWDFSTGNTNPETYPADDLVAAASKAIPEMASLLNRYHGKFGHEGLRRLMAERESEREGVPVDFEQLVLTNGSMQGVTLVAETLCEGHDDVVVMEEFCYSGTVAAYRALGIEMVPVPGDGLGMRVDDLAEIMARLNAEGRKPRFIYSLATYQNPTGAVMSTERRLRLIEIAKQYDCTLVEDNCYGDVHFEGPKPPALYALDDWPNQIYLCSLSKIFAPGVRLGYFIAKPPLLDRLLARRHDAGPNTFAAAITHEYLKDRLWEHCETANRALKIKRDAMLDALEANLGNKCSWSRPVGGLFIWVRMPDDIDMAKLAEIAEERGVGFVPGASYQLHGEEVPYIRLAFGYPSVDDIESGIPVLAECIEAARGA